MAFAITQSCCTDASCVTACPVNCIHPRPDEPDFGRVDMLYIDPRACIDCGACVELCPVDAIFPADALSGPLAEYPAINAEYFLDSSGRGRPPAPPLPEGSPLFHSWSPVRFDRVLPADFPELDVAVVGSGPAGMYAVQDLLLHTTARVTLIDRLEVPGGLVRFGVAPDHPSTKKIADTFAHYHSHHRMRMRLGVEVGEGAGQVTADDLAREYDAVIYAVGASTARDLGVPGEDLPGSLASTTAVGWYNGHPEIDPDAVALDTGRAVVIGTGNVALDLARILAGDPDTIADSTIAGPALERLRAGAVREVVLLGRRGPEDASYTRGELLGLLRRDDLEVVVDDHDPRIGEAIDAAGPGEPAALLRDVPRVRLDPAAPPDPDRRRIVLRFRSSPLALHGDGRVEGLRVSSGSDDVGDVDLATGLVVRSIGHRGRPVPGLPFDAESGTVPHREGRVEGMPGTYVVGWIKRGATGGIGVNRGDAAETVASLIADAGDGAIGRSRTGRLGAVARRLGLSRG